MSEVRVANCGVSHMLRFGLEAHAHLQVELGRVEQMSRDPQKELWEPQWRGWRQMARPGIGTGGYKGEHVLQKRWLQGAQLDMLSSTGMWAPPASLGLPLIRDGGTHHP